ncbi:response regulator [uncultured Ferrimonas sp.]|uniref:response regulator n=1 Tax=uncultured Ferrimonas sp. TaxID=432640 RepID=UPI002633EF88|nr:response regulator [uncultured Ferrimonas sp.]
MSHCAERHNTSLSSKILATLFCALMFFAQPIQAAAEPQERPSELAVELANLSSIFLYNLDQVQLQQTLLLSVKRNQRIKTLRVFDTIGEELFFSYHRIGNTEYINQPVPLGNLQYQKHTANIIYEGELIGLLELYYDNSGSNSSQGIHFSPAEQAWLVKNHSLKVGVFDSSPYIGTDADGHANGLMIDYLNVIARYTNLQFEYVYGSFDEMMTLFKQDKIDILPSVAYHPSRLDLGLFAKPEIRSRYFFYVPHNSTIREQTDFSNKTIAIIRSSIGEREVHTNFKDSTIITTDSMLESINAVLDGRADALFGPQLNVLYELEQNGLVGLRAVSQNLIAIQQEQLLLQQHMPLLNSIIDKTVSTLSGAEQRQMFEQYIAEAPQLDQTFSGDFQQKVWLLGGLFISLFLLLGIIARAMFRGVSERSSLAFGSERFALMVKLAIAIYITICVAGSWFILERAREDSLEQRRQLQLSALRSAENNMQHLLKTYSVVFEGINQRPLFIDPLERLLLASKFGNFGNITLAQQQLVSYMNQFSAPTPDRIRVLLSTDGDILLNQGPQLSKLSLQQHFPNLLRYALSGQATLIPPMMVPNQQGIPIRKSFVVSPVRNSKRNIVAILLHEFRGEQELKKSLNQYFFGDTTEVLMFDKDGRVISETRFDNPNQFDDKKLSSYSPKLAETLRLQNNGNQLFDFSDYRNVNVMAVARWNGQLNAYIVAKTDRSEALAQYYRFRSEIIIILLLTFSFAVPSILFTLNLGRRANDRLSASKHELELKVEERTRELSELELRSRLILSSVGQGLFGIDRHGKVIFINDAAINLLQLSHDHVVGFELLPALFGNNDMDYNDPTQSKIISTLHNGETITQRDIFIRQQEQDHLPVEYTCRAIISDDRIGGCVVVFSDISERIAMEEAIELARIRAEEASQAKSQFLANMSHEIRTPMNAIIGMSHLILQTSLTRKQRNFAEKVQYSAHSLLGIINDILDFSKIEAGKMQMESVPFRLDDVLDGVADIIGLKAEEKKLELLFDLPADVPQNLVGDPLRLNQILLNLGNNAVKFTESGEILVSVQLIQHQGDRLCLRFNVADTGIGLDQYQISKLFSSFSQADASTTRRFGGTGLGLAICSSLVQLMDGKIWVESELHQGATFSFEAWFELPSAPVLHSPTVNIDGTGQRVLIVDDNEHASEILSTMLESFGYEVESANCGSIALEMIASAFQRRPYDLLFLDWKMPKIDGVATARCIEQNYPLNQRPKIIMITAYGKDEAADAASELQVNEFLAKPIIRTHLLSAIHRINGNGHETPKPKPNNDQLQQWLTQLQGAHILLVEDNELNQELAAEILKTNGMTVELANNGQEALDLLEIKQYDGVLMDCQMPVMDGYEATERLRQDPRFQQLPILAMTANAMVGDREKVIAAGMNDHIAKPIELADLFNKMAQWITPSQPIKAVTAVTFSVSDTHHDARSQLPALEGIDIEAGLVICQGRVDSYRKLLRKFASNQAQFGQQLQQALAQEDFVVAQRLAHTLKGVAGTIGAKSLQNDALKLETALANRQELVWPLEQEQTLTGLERVLTSIAELDEQSTPKPTTAGSHSVDIDALLEQLHRLLDDDDTSAIDVAEQLASALQDSGDAHTLIGKIQVAIESYDFELGAELLQTLQRELTDSADSV